MFYRTLNSCQRLKTTVNGHPESEPMLKHSTVLRYDRSHAGASKFADEQRETGEAEMDKTGPGSVDGDRSPRPSQPLSEPHAEPATPDSSSPHGAADDPEITGSPDSVSRRSETRAEQLARVQKEIAAGTYETAEKLEVAVERLLRDIR